MSLSLTHPEAISAVDEACSYTFSEDSRHSHWNLPCGLSLQVYCIVAMVLEHSQRDMSTGGDGGDLLRRQASCDQNQASPPDCGGS